MAFGDVVKGKVASVAANGYADIRPTAGVVWNVVCVESPSVLELYASDGSSDDLVDSAVAAPSRFAYYGMLCTNDSYYRAKNVGASAANVWYSAIDVTPA